MSRLHIVVSNETLAAIAKMHGVALSILKKINDLSSYKPLPIRTKVYLREEDVLGVQAMFLDVDRNPICNQKYLFDFNGRSIKGETNEGGMTKKVFTNSPHDVVKISIVRLDNSLKSVAEVTSGYGNKLITILAPRYRADSKAELDSAARLDAKGAGNQTTKPIYDSNSLPSPTTGKQDLGPNVTPSKTVGGRPLAKVEGDIADLDLILDEYSEKNLSDADIEAAAKELKCEPGLIYAIARQESSTSSFFKIKERTVPKILFERHWFRKLTKPDKKSPSPYEEKYPDICGPAYHLAKKNKKKELIDKVTDKLAVADDIYGAEGLPQYKRLLKAYQLAPEEALQACSWGKFQIMGFNYKAAGFKNVREFVKAMSRNDAEHMKAFLRFAKANAVLSSGLKNVDFEKIAEGHNGAEWQSINPHYAGNLEKFYKEYLKNHDK